MKCTNCNYPLLDEKFCPICGEKVEKNGVINKNSRLVKSIEDLKKGNEEGFIFIYNHTYNYVYSRAKCMFEDEQEAQDLVQEVYLAVYKSIGNLESPEKLYGWLKTIIFNQGTKLIKKRSKAVLVSEEYENMFESLPDEASQTESEFMDKQDIDIIRLCVERLSEEQKSVVLAYYYDNLKVDEIATLFDISEGTVKSRLYLARKKLKEYVEEQEKKLGYKLHSFGGITLLFALRAMLLDNMENSTTSKKIVLGQVHEELKRVNTAQSTIEQPNISTTSLGKGSFVTKITEMGTKKIALSIVGIVSATAVVGAVAVASSGDLFNDNKEPTVIVNETEMIFDDSIETEIVEELETVVLETETSEEKTDSSEIVKEEEEPSVVVTDDMIAVVKERNIAYRNLLTDSTAFGDGRGASMFGLTDIDGNGVEELLVCIQEPDLWQYPGTIVTWMNGEIVWGFDAWAKTTMYYCPATGYFSTKELINPYENKSSLEGFNGYIQIFKFESQSINREYGYPYLNSLFMVEVDDKGQYLGYSAEEANGIIANYMPTEILLESPYKNTNSNLEKYLPIEDEKIRMLLEGKEIE